MSLTTTTTENIAKLRQNIKKVMHGKDDVIDLCIVALLGRGHVLLEDVPGVGKTTLASTIAQSIHGSFQRIQFTSDMLPSDILGVTIYDQQSHEFEFRQGPIFANVVLADEINRTSPKTQSALLEAMNIGQVSIDRQTYTLPRPFIVLATQNPVEFAGTFPLPKSQMDRFLVRLHLGYPARDAEMQVLREQAMSVEPETAAPVVSANEVLEMQEVAARNHITDDLLDYIIRIAEATRNHPKIELGCSTRGAIALRRCAQAYAVVRGRDYTVPDDIKAVAPHVLAHRLQIVRTFDRGFSNQGDDIEIVREILESVAPPI